eukprot:scaffold75669_cov51-Phaeocystis_antarctica.AAC.4
MATFTMAILTMARPPGRRWSHSTYYGYTYYGYTYYGYTYLRVRDGADDVAPRHMVTHHMALAPRVTLVRGRVWIRVRLGWGLAFSPWATGHPAIETGRVAIVGYAATNYGYTHYGYTCRGE